MYQFKRIKVAGWDYYEATPSLTEEHHVGFPVDGITPFNRYQLLMFVDAPTVVTLDNPELTQIMQPGQTSMEFDIVAFPKDSLWIERPSEEGARRLCLAPAGPMRRWKRTVNEIPAGGRYVAQDGQLCILLAGSATIDGENVLPGAIVESNKTIEAISAITMIAAV